MCRQVVRITPTNGKTLINCFSTIKAPSASKPAGRRRQAERAYADRRRSEFSQRNNPLHRCSDPAELGLWSACADSQTVKAAQVRNQPLFALYISCKRKKPSPILAASKHVIK